MSDVLVLGSGIAGLGAALALQARGVSCRIIDRAEPGTETSYGNAGILQSEASEPYALPRHPGALLAMALGHENAAVLHPSALMSQTGPLLRYWHASRPANMARVAAVYQRLIAESIPAHASLIEAAGLDNLIQRDGYWQVYYSPTTLDIAATAAERMRALYGHRMRIVDGMELAQAEPELKFRLAGAVLWSDPWRVTDPGALVQGYAALFRARGGEIVTGDAMTLEQDGAGWRVGPHRAGRVVVALGPWSPDLLRRFGYRIPMVAKRGYHAHYNGEQQLNRAMVDAEHNIVLSPMRQGLRIATGAELSARPPAEDPRQLRRGEEAARALLDIGQRVEPRAWAGTRPCLPGMLPLVTEAPRHKGLWLHFGHGHQGFTLGPATGNRLARAMTGEANAIDGLSIGLS
ncbi:FAD-binding oxidoreductase [Puniceibacterium sp. IMCC21224]|uniref:NAD(P)/FAD-dependent oxidoreductase n=1 Tax=Puniceibacterium sp. IMCC21224 TaxID=1618204 RepID=UPI00064D9D5C|nr:FAD-dependent oxidoreductase [Puniceibacterium sp. IMCC21224]